MYDAYWRIFERLGLKFRAVQADTGAIGGDASQEFHVLADSGEDAIAFSDGSDYAANLEAAEAVRAGRASGRDRGACAGSTRRRRGPARTSPRSWASRSQRTVKSVAVMGRATAAAFVLALVRGDHVVNEVKLAKLAGLADYRLATEAEIARVPRQRAGLHRPGRAGEPIAVVADRSVAAMADFVAGANSRLPPRRRQLGPRPAGTRPRRRHPQRGRGRSVARRPGTLGIARGIEVGHVFQLGQKYAEAMKRTVLDENGKAAVTAMGCYGIGVSRIVAAAIEQNFDAAGIVWPDGDGAVAGRGVRDQPEERRRRRRRRRGAVRRAERRRRRSRARRPRPAPRRDVRRHRTDRHPAPRGGFRARPRRRARSNTARRRASEAENLDGAALLAKLGLRTDALAQAAERIAAIWRRCRRAPMMRHARCQIPDPVRPSPEPPCPSISTACRPRNSTPLINQAKKRKTTLSKRKPLAAGAQEAHRAGARPRVTSIAELFGGAPTATPRADGQAAAKRTSTKGQSSWARSRRSTAIPTNPSETWAGRGQQPSWLAAETGKGRSAGRVPDQVIRTAAAHHAKRRPRAGVFIAVELDFARARQRFRRADSSRLPNSSPAISAIRVFSAASSGVLAGVDVLLLDQGQHAAQRWRCRAPA